MKSSLPKGPPLDLPGALGKSGQKTKKNAFSAKMHFFFVFVFFGLDLPKAPGISKGGPFGRPDSMVFHLFFNEIIIEELPFWGSSWPGPVLIDFLCFFIERCEIIVKT